MIFNILDLIDSKPRFFFCFFLLFLVGSSEEFLIYNHETIVAICFCAFLFVTAPVVLSSLEESLIEREKKLTNKLASFVKLNQELRSESIIVNQNKIRFESLVLIISLLTQTKLEQTRVLSKTQNINFVKYTKIYNEMILKNTMNSNLKGVLAGAKSTSTSSIFQPWEVLQIWGNPKDASLNHFTRINNPSAYLKTVTYNPDVVAKAIVQQYSRVVLKDA